MSQDVEKLWELQQVATQLDEREKQLSSKPEAFAAVDREWTAASAEMEQLQQSIDSISRERRRVDGELSDQQELLKKYQGQLMQVKNQQQYAAAWKEIDATRKHVKELEDSTLKSMTEIDGLQQQLDQRREASTALKSRWDEEHGKWQGSLGGLRGEVETLKGKMAQIESGLPERLKREFHKIAKQRGGIGVSRVDSDSCSSCRTRVRPQVMQQLKRGELVHCEGCHRILYWEKPES